MSDAEHPSDTESCQHALDVFSVVVRHGSAGIEVMCQADEDISAFREAIAARTGVPSSRQKLVTAGRVLPLNGACRDILAPRAKVLLLATSGEAAGSAEAASIEVACEQELERDRFHSDGPWEHPRSCRQIVAWLQTSISGGHTFRSLVDEFAAARPAPLSLIECLRVALCESEVGLEHTAPALPSASTGNISGSQPQLCGDAGDITTAAHLCNAPRVNAAVAGPKTSHDGAVAVRPKGGNKAVKFKEAVVNLLIEVLGLAMDADPRAKGRNSGRTKEDSQGENFGAPRPSRPVPSRGARGWGRDVRGSGAEEIARAALGLLEGWVRRDAGGEACKGGDGAVERDPALSSGV